MKKSLITSISCLLENYTLLTVSEPNQMEYTIHEEKKGYTLRIYSIDPYGVFFERVIIYSLGLNGQILKISEDDK